MKKMYISNVPFLIHNKREELWFKDLMWQVETLRKYLTDSTQLSDYNESERRVIIDTRLQRLYGELHCAFWLDVIKDSIYIHNDEDFKLYFM